MDVVLWPLRAVILTLFGFFVWLGSLFGTPIAAIHAPEPSPAYFPAATSTPHKQSAATTTLSSKPKPIKMPVTPGPILPPLPTLSTEELNTLARSALVNIFCTTAQGGTFNPISGSGVFIDNRGIILTNAHVGQYFLLEGAPYEVQCVVRTGSPAQPRYMAELLYLPPAWIAANADKLKSQTPTGTGENDYAFLRVTGSITGTPLPPSFPALPMEAGEPSTGDGAFIAAYPAGFIGGITIATSLYSTSANARVGQLYSFSDASHVDLFSLGGTIVAQSGSSGGPALSPQGKLEGIIATEVPAETTAGRDLRAVTISHIDRSLRAAGEGGIVELLSQDIAAYAARFNASVAPGEKKTLLDAIAH